MWNPQPYSLKNNLPAKNKTGLSESTIPVFGLISYQKLEAKTI